MEQIHTKVLLRKFLHWYSISRERGKAFRFLRKPFARWRQFTRQQLFLRGCEKRARTTLRVCRINHALGLCLQSLAISRISSAAEVGRWLQTKQTAHVPMATRLDFLLAEYESAHTQDSVVVDKETSTLTTKLLYIQGKTIPLSVHDLAGLMALKQCHWLLLQFESTKEERIDTMQIVVDSASLRQEAASPIDRLQFHLKQSLAVDIGNDGDDPSTLPAVHILDLIGLSEEITSVRETFKKNNPALNRSILEDQYISTGLVEDYHADPSYDEHDIDDFEVGMDDDALFDGAEKASFAKYLSDISNTSRERSHLTRNDAEQASLVDDISAEAIQNLRSMKQDVDKSLLDARSSKIHLTSYKGYVEKKKKQKTQCLRDMQSHCCTCRGPHISKPPFSHAKDFRREPTHVQHQGNKCMFLKKKRAELKWLDETLGNYGKNNGRFEREIERRKAETQSRKKDMATSLAESLRLMDMLGDGGE